MSGREPFATPEPPFAPRGYRDLGRMFTVPPMTLRLDETLCLRNGGTARFATVAELVLIAVHDNYTEVTLADGGRMVVRKSLKAWLEVLPATHFQRVHRAMIVNLARVVRYERTTDEHTWLYLDSVALPIPASRRTWPRLRVSLAALHAGF